MAPSIFLHFVIYLASSSTLSVRKANLLSAIAHARQGRDISQRPHVEVLFKLLEETNPTPRPLESSPEKLSACWKLIYTTSNSILGMSRPPPFRPRQRILQHIDTSRLLAKNEVRARKACFLHNISAWALTRAAAVPSCLCFAFSSGMGPFWLA